MLDHQQNQQNLSQPITAPFDCDLVMDSKHTHARLFSTTK